MLEKICTLEELKIKQRIIYKAGNKNIVLYYVNNKIYASDNRCPHEGYPLAQGTINPEDQTLTCNWHNWKFKLKSGSCLVGGDNVRVYKTQLKEEEIWLDLSDPPPHIMETTLLNSVQKSLEDLNYGRIIRELARMHFSNLDMKKALSSAIIWSHDKFEYGTTHAYAAAADWLNIYEGTEEIECKLTTLAEALHHIAWDSLRHPTYSFGDKVLPFNEVNFLKAIEEEKYGIAYALIKGFTGDYSTLEKTFVKAALAHYNDFGHSLIYVQKTFDLIEKLGTEVALPLLLSLTRSIAYATREDLLPEFEKYRHCLKKFPQVFSTQVNPEIPVPKMSANNTMKWLSEHVKKYSADSLYQSLLNANAKNLLYFDIKYQYHTDLALSDNVGWLDFTHAITFANAVHNLCQKYPEFWPQGLLQMAAFYGRNSKYTSPEESDTEWKVHNETAFWNSYQDILFDHGIGLPIFSAHLLKTGEAIKEELNRNISPSGKEHLLAAFHRFMNTPPKQKHVRRAIKQNLKLVKKDFV